MKRWACAIGVAMGLSMGVTGELAAAPPALPTWHNPSLPPDGRANLLLAQMSQEDKLALIRSYFAGPRKPGDPPMPAGAIGSAGYIPANARLGIPALQMSDAGLGVANSDAMRPGDWATPLPAGPVTAASFDPEVARRGGAMIGAQARAKGFNVLLAGGINLMREPRNGRNFEYAGEDPLLAGRIVGATVAGVQGNHVLSTIKHYALNDQETGRNSIDVRVGESAMRESDLLAFELAIEAGQPGAVMCSYNKVNGDWACENDVLLQQILKQAWRYPGFVMSDWGAVHSAAKAANAGLDQESAGEMFDGQVFFDKPLRAALAQGAVKPERLDDMVHRILRSMFAVGLFDAVKAPPIDATADLAVARQTLAAGAVLLRNQHDELPLDTRKLRTIAVIGSHADKGVLAGGGSSTVLAQGGNAVPGIGPSTWPGPEVFHPYPPLAALREAAPAAKVGYAEGDDVAAAVALARQSDVAVVFVHQWMAESIDAPSLTLPDHQDALVTAVAKANPHTVVVLENGSPVAMPWLDRVGAVLETWYPGGDGGHAIADLLTGKVNPSGRLPFTWPRDVAQLPRPELPGAGGGTAPASVNYDVEGARVGYRWFQAKGETPLFPFGFGLSYTHFEHGALSITQAGDALTAHVVLRNTGSREGAEVAQVYVRLPGDASRRLAGFAKVDLKPGASRALTIPLERRVLARFDATAHRWTWPSGAYVFAEGASSATLGREVSLTWPARP